jgi:hypothetical protein
MTLDELRTELRDGFKRIEDEFVNVRTEVRDGFKNIDDQFKNVDDQFSKIRAEAQDHAETTRRHFDIVAESLRESVKIVAEGNAHGSSRLDNHETRLKRLERPRRR